MKNLTLTEKIIMQLDNKYTKEELIQKFMIADRDLALVSSQYDDLWYEHKEMSCELANLKWDIENGYISKDVDVKYVTPCRECGILFTSDSAFLAEVRTCEDCLQKNVVTLGGDI